MNKNKKRIAFSLFEAVVVMGIVAIFVASATNVFTKKHKKQTDKTPHGRFECYYNGNQLVQQTFHENMSAQLQNLSTDYCIFKPVRRASYYVLNLVGGGGGGASSYGGAAGTYRSFFIPTVQKELRIYPGKGSSSANGGTSFVREVLSNGNLKDLASVPGGNSGFDLQSISAKHVSNCAVTTQKYACNIDATCTVYDQYLYVTYCVAEEMSSENNESAHSQESISYAEISRKGVYTATSQKVTYERPGETTGPSTSPYTLTLSIATNTAGDGGELSQFVGYLHAIGVNSGIVAASPGSGGAKNQPGKHGGAVVTW